MTFRELLEKMRKASKSGSGGSEVGFKLDTWLMIMEHIDVLTNSVTGDITKNIDLMNQRLEETTKELENTKTIQQVADRIMF